MTKKYPSIQVINRASSLLDAITRDKQPVSLKVLAADTGLHPATAFRILGALAGNGLTERDDKGRYRIGAQLSAINARADMNISFCRAAQNTMDLAQREFGCHVVLGTRDRDYLIPVQDSEAMDTETSADQPQHYVHAAMLHQCGGGRLLLANAGRRNFERYVRRARCREDCTDISEESQVNALWNTIEREQQQGYAIDSAVAQQTTTLTAIVDPTDMWRTLTIGTTYSNTHDGRFDQASALGHLQQMAAQLAQLDQQANDLQPAVATQTMADSPKTPGSTEQGQDRVVGETSVLSNHSVST